MTHATLLLSPLKAAVSASGGYLDVLIRLQAPDWPADHALTHHPKRLALVVDRSGSMNGRPLTEALRCVMHIAKHLTPQDQMSLVTYDDEVEVMLPLGLVTSLAPIEEAIDRIQSGGATDLHSGWLRGATELEGATPSAISRVVLLSDGQANRGETHVDTIAQHCKAWFERGVSTTTVGLGRGFNEDLMIAMAKAGGGQQYYGQTAEDLYDSFDQELALLQAMYWRGIRAKLIPAPGVIVEVLGGHTPPHPDGSHPMTDLAWGAEAWLAVRLHLSTSAEDSMRDLLAVSVTAIDLQGQTVSADGAMLQLPVVSRSAWQSMSADPLVEKRLQELEFGREAMILRELAKAGKRDEAQRQIARLEQQFGEHPWLHAKLAQMRRLAESDMEMMAKEVSYSSARMSSLAFKSEIRYAADETESEMPAFLRRKESEGRGRRTPR